MFEVRLPRQGPRRSAHADDVVPELAGWGASSPSAAARLAGTVDWASLHTTVPRFSGAMAGSPATPAFTATTLRVQGPITAASFLRTRLAVSLEAAGKVAHTLRRTEAPTRPRRTMMDPEQRIWGFETSFGGLAERNASSGANQLSEPPPGREGRRHQALSQHGIPAVDLLQEWCGRLGSRVLITTGRERRPRLPPTQMARHGISPVCVVSSADKAEILPVGPSSSTGGPRAASSGTRRAPSGTPRQCGHPCKKIRELHRRARLSTSSCRAPGPRDPGVFGLRHPPRAVSSATRLDPPRATAA